MKAILTALIIFLSVQISGAEELPQRFFFTTDAFRTLTSVMQRAYVAGLADGLSISAERPQQQVKMIATCMQGFPLERLTDTAADQQSMGQRQVSLTTPAAESIVSKLSWVCQLQWPASTDTK